MPKSTDLNFPQNLSHGLQTFENGDGTGLKTIINAGTEGTRIFSIIATNDDSGAATNLHLYINDGSTDFLFATVRIPASSGTDGAAKNMDIISSVDLPGLAFDANGKNILTLAGGHVLKASAIAAVASGKKVTVAAFAEDY